MPKNRYIIYAKILGDFLPNKSCKIGGCTIKKDYRACDLQADRPEIPVRNRTFEYHVLERGVKNFIVYPQQSDISVRNFESDYIMFTEVSNNSFSDANDAYKEAQYRFMDLTAALTLSVRNSSYKVGSKRTQMTDRFYDFEIVAMFIKRGKKIFRLKLPEPLVTIHNFFPKEPSSKFKTSARKYLSYREPIFRKAMVYLQRSLLMRRTGHFSNLDASLNLIKLIELIAKNTDKINRFGLTKKKYSKLPTKELIEYSGALLKVANKNINRAKKVWDERNTRDIGHQTEFYNIFSRESHDLIDWISLEQAAADYLTKYYKYSVKNSKINFFIKDGFPV